MAQLYSPGWQQKLGSAMWKDTEHAHAKIAEAIMAGEAGLAKSRMRKHLQAEADFYRRRRHTKQLLPDSVVLAESGQGKGAEAVARNIARSIVSEGLQPGELVGTESELIEREGVSRALLREAVRLLEHHQIARMRRGPGGGLFVMAPSAHAVTEGHRHLPGPPRHDAGRLGRAADGRRGRHHRPGGDAGRRGRDGRRCTTR